VMVGMRRGWVCIAYRGPRSRKPAGDKPAGFSCDVVGGHPKLWWRGFQRGVRRGDRYCQMVQRNQGIWIYSTR
jgi:hypothetical protein